jgi:hypothetical protein
MRYPVQTHDTPRISGPLLSALAVVAASLFIGNWVIGPALTHKTPAAPTTDEPLSDQAMMARPDPSPYRAATPAFDMSSNPSYGTAAREKARAELGGHRTPVEDSSANFQPTTTGAGSDDRPQTYQRYQVRDRHTGVF